MLDQFLFCCIIDDMEEFLNNNQNIINILAVITGYVFTFLAAKFSFRYEIKKLRKQKLIEKMENAPYDLFKALSLLNRGDVINCSACVNDYGDRILAYGSKDSIEIYKSFIEKTSENENDIMNIQIHLVLLACQLRYDLCSEISSPEDWFTARIIKINSKQKRELADRTNALIKELSLNKKFIVKY